MSGTGQDASRGAATIWALAAAIVVEASLNVEWWHPYCDHQEDGPAAMAFGFPLPYIAPSTISSMEWLLRPELYAVNIMVLGALAYPLASVLIRKFSRHRRQVPVAALSALALVIGLLGFMQVGQSHLTSSLAYGSDLEWRPAVLALRNGHKACDRREPPYSWTGRMPLSL